jgi:hypothetical protein
MAEDDIPDAEAEGMDLGAEIFEDGVITPAEMEQVQQRYENPDFFRGMMAEAVKIPSLVAAVGKATGHQY